MLRKGRDGEISTKITLNKEEREETGWERKRWFKI
jgi:hypothetical protein